MQAHNIGVVSSIPPFVTFKTPLVRKATGSHLMRSASLEKTLEIEYAVQCGAVRREPSKNKGWKADASTSEMG